MNNAEIWETVTKLFCETLDLNNLVLSPETTAKDVDGWDSLSHILLVVAVERKFGITFNTGEIDELENVGQFVELIERRRKG